VETTRKQATAWAVEAVFLRPESGRTVRRVRYFATIAEAESYAATMAVVAKCELQRVDSNK